MWLTYSVIAVILLIAELAYFRIADKCNIIDKPNERSSHSTIVLRGGGVIFSLSMVVGYPYDDSRECYCTLSAVLVWTGTDMWH